MLSTSSLARLNRLYHSPQCCPPCLKKRKILFESLFPDQFTCDIPFPLVTYLAGRAPLTLWNKFRIKFSTQRHLFGRLSLLPPPSGGSFSSSSRMSLDKLFKYHVIFKSWVGRTNVDNLKELDLHNLFVSSVSWRPPRSAAVQLCSPLRWKTAISQRFTIEKIVLRPTTLVGI